jgi:glycosyltransferase involved in cell wall biosynthesis
MTTGEESFRVQTRRFPRESHAFPEGPTLKAQSNTRSDEPRANGAERTRVVLFTDTLGDVNGVSRFIRTIAEVALREGVDLHVITSTRFECPLAPNVHNIRPRYARPMPGYSTLDVVWPDTRAMMALAERLQPTVVHVSTPGSVGSVGRKFAIKRGLPLVGTYHTDFPAYVEHLFDDAVLTWMTRKAMRRFYAPFAAVFTRSVEYERSLREIGIDAERVRRLIPGIDLAAFDASLRDEHGDVWASMPGARRTSRKVLYVGRLSVEKNLPWLVEVWKRTRVQLVQAGVDAQLIIVGDGPYRVRMEAALSGEDAVFAGFRHGRELAAIYASSDVFVFPSMTDTLGQVVMEAQCSGLPVIVTDRGGPKEVVDEGVTGWVLPVNLGDRPFEKWSDAILWLLRDDMTRRAMSAAGRTKVTTMSIERSFQDFWNVHERVAEECRRDGAGKYT